MTKHERTLAIALEAVACCIILAGIAVEVATRAAVGYVLISSGCLMAVVGGMLYAKVFRKR